METLLNLDLALTLGLLVGVERGWQEREAAEGSRLRSLSAVVLADSVGIEPPNESPGKRIAPRQSNSTGR